LDAHADMMNGHDFRGQSKLVRLVAAQPGRAFFDRCKPVK
jgi:hypothetical protein